MQLAVIERGELARHWWMLLLRGLAGAAFGLLALLAPGPSLAVLVLAWGFFALFDGVMLIVSAFRRRGAQAPWYLVLLEGAVGIGAGVVTFLYPGLTTFALLYLIAAWALVTGVIEVVEAIRLRKVITGEWMLILRGVLSVAFGVGVAVFPAIGALVLMVWLGAFSLAIGILLIVLSIQLHSHRDDANWRRPRHVFAHG